MRKPKLTSLPNTMAILVNGSIQDVDPNKIPDREYKEALALGTAELIHQGKLKLDDILI